MKITWRELQSVWQVKNTFEREKNRLCDLQVLSESTTALLDGMPHAKPLTFKVERITALIVECEGRIERLADEFVKAQCDLLNKLEALNLEDIYLRILNYHYVACKKFGEISRLMNFTFQNTKKIFRQAIKALGLNMEELGEYKSSIEFNGVQSSSIEFNKVQ